MLALERQTECLRGLYQCPERVRGRWCWCHPARPGSASTPLIYLVPVIYKGQQDVASTIDYRRLLLGAQGAAVDLLAAGASVGCGMNVHKFAITCALARRQYVKQQANLVVLPLSGRLSGSAGDISVGQVHNAAQAVQTP